MDEKNNLKTRNNKVFIPDYYYKVILDYTDPEIKGIGFILPNKSSQEPLQAYAVTIAALNYINKNGNKVYIKN